MGKKRSPSVNEKKETSSSFLTPYEIYESTDKKPGDLLISKKEDRDRITEKLGKYNFLGNVFMLTPNEKIINTEIDDNNRRIKGAELMESFRKCRKCGSRNIQSVPFQIAAADEAIPLKNTCLRCGFMEIER